MLINVIGKTGSGKSLYQSYLAYTELTKIMRNGTDKPWYWRIPYISRLFLGSYYSQYDVVCMNSEFNDSRGNSCTWDFEQKKWISTGHVMGVTDVPELYDINNALVFLDEAGTYFSNRDWALMPPRYRLFLTTHRHNATSHAKRFDIYVFSQQKDLIEADMERISTQIYLIRPLFGFALNPTKPRWYNKIPAIKIWIYWKHEVLQGKPFQELDRDGRPIPVSMEEQLEALIPYTWLWLGRKYRNCYDSLSVVRELERTKGK